MNIQDNQNVVSEELSRTVEKLFESGDVVELRCFGDGVTYSGYYDDFEKLTEEAANQDRRGRDVYMTLNELKPELLYRRKNRMERMKGRDAATSDGDIKRRRYVFFDFDCKRSSSISSTDEEKLESRKRMLEALTWLKAMGWPEPIICDSGNGYHLLFPIDLPNNPDALALISAVLEALDFKFSDEAVEVDQTTKNAARITKYYGTVAKKGDNDPERPHRPSRILKAPENPVGVSREQLVEVAATKPEPPKRNRHSRNGHAAPEDKRERMEAWLEEHPEISIKREGPWLGSGWRWIPEECPNGHTDGAAYITATPDGWVQAKCHHNSCEGLDLRDFMEHYEPGAYDRLFGRGTGPDGDEGDTDSTDGSDSYFHMHGQTPKFPTEAMPVKTRAFIREAAAAIDCSVDLVGLPTLGALSAAIGFSWEAQRSEDYTQSAALYLACVDEPGSGKSPAAKAAVRPVKDQQRKLKEEYEALKEKYEDDLREYEAKKKQAAKEGKAAERPPEKPTFSRTWVDDTTIEAMAKTLDENPRGVYLIQDELTGWIKGFDQYKTGGKGSTRQKYLQIWSNETISVDRVGRDEPTIVERPFVTICGGIQPKLLQEIADGRDDGFIDRFLIAYPETHVSYDNDNVISAKARMAYHGLIEKLYETKDAEEPLEFTPAAQEAYKKHSHKLSDEQKYGALPPGLKNAWSKMRAYLIRLSFIMAVCRMAETDDDGDAEITEGDVENAATLFEYFKDMARKVHRQSDGSVTETKVASELIHLLRTGDGQKKATAAEFQRMLPSAPDTPEATSHMLERIAKGTAALEFERGYRGKERVIKISLLEEKTVGTVGTVGGESHEAPQAEASERVKKSVREGASPKWAQPGDSPLSSEGALAPAKEDHEPHQNGSGDPETVDDPGVRFKHDRPRQIPDRRALRAWHHPNPRRRRLDSPSLRRHHRRGGRNDSGKQGDPAHHPARRRGHVRGAGPRGGRRGHVSRGSWGRLVGCRRRRGRRGPLPTPLRKRG
jgi:hypothetical protein